MLDHFYYVSSDEEWEHSFDANSLFGVLLIIMYYVLTIMSLNLQLLYLLSLSICVLLKVFFGVLFNVDVVFFARVPGTTDSNGVFRCLRNVVRHRLFGESSKQLSVVL